MIETRWTLKVEMLAEYNNFQNVIDNVHWRVIATDTKTGATESIYGSQAVPKPTDKASYIDITTMIDMDADTKRKTILGWAEMVEPGFVSAKEAQVVATLQARQEATALAVVALL